MYLKSILFGGLALLVTGAAVPGLAQDDTQQAIAARKGLMQANGAAAALAGAMMKGDLAYNPAVARSVIATFRAVSLSLGAHFPEGSHGEGTRAAPAIWEKADEFAAMLAKLQGDTAAAAEASGREGPADLAAFQSAVQPILGDCQTCHEQFRTN